MLKRKLSTLILAATITNLVATPIQVLAETLPNTVQSVEVIEESQNKKATITKFTLQESELLESYNKAFKMDNSNIEAITNNGGKYGSSTIDKAIDGNIKTHWETGTANSTSFINEVVITLKESTKLNRIVYGARRDAGGKGFAEEVEIYASNTNEGNDFELVASGEYTGSKTDIVEIKFESTEFKRVKFVFKKANQNWASASEFMFYKEDNIIDKMNNIFTNDLKNELSEEFNTLEKLEAFELEASTHPLYSEIAEDINNARIILEGKELEFTEAKVSNFKPFNDERLSSYDELFKVPLEKVTSITTNGGQYSSNNIARAMDGDVNTNWHSGKQNTATHTNEVVITLDELTTIDRIMYTSLVSRGFAQEFEIYGSRTSEGDTFEKISTGSTSITTKNTLQIRFKETEVRRIKFVYKKGYENWALASEFGLYMPDKLDQKIDILFVDENMNEVNPEFGTVEAINNLIEEANDHPFEDEYIEKLNIARELVQFGKVQGGTANVSKFEAFYTDYINEYDDVYRVNNLRISNNGGQYSSSAIKYAIDEDVNTHWETGKPNSNSFKNEVILTLEEAEVISRLTYKARPGAKGFAEQFSIYISPVASGDNFQKITEGSYTVTSDMLEIQFDATKAKRVKFVFDKAREDWASISDIRLYREDSVSKKMKTLFTNGLMDTVSDEFNTMENLLALESEVSEHPLAPVYLKDIQMAKDILNDTLETVKTVVAEQYGDRNAHANKNLKFGFGNNNQPTGVVALAGDTITVYVDAEAGQPLPQLMFSQQEGSFASWGRTVSLHIGKNVITVPKTSQNDGWYNHDVTPGGPVYIVNPYTEEQQGKAPVIRFSSGCEQFPMMDANTDEQEFLELLKDYKARVDADKAANPNVMDRKMIDVAEVSSDHLVFTGTATGAYEAYINQEFGPMNTVNMYNDHMDMVFNYYGLDGSNENNDIKYTRENIRLAQPFGYMYAAGGHIGVQGDVMVAMLTSIGGWGVDHEMGHKLDIGVRTIGEVTNNMIPQHSSYYYNSPNKRIPFESHVFKNVLATDNNNYYNGGFFENLAVFWQLEMIYPGYWGKLNSQYRENNVVLDSENASNDKLNQLAKYSSIALELDLSEHFERHGFWVSDETKELLSKYQKPDIKTWYANYDYIEYEGEGFTGNPELSVNVLKENENVKLSFSVNEEFKNDVLGYEIFKDGELIGFTSTNSFVDTELNIGESVNYTIIPYDKKLNTGDKVVVNSLTPSLSLQQQSIIIKLREEFNPMDLVKALNYNDEDISSNVVINGQVNVNEKGIYPLEYIIEDNGVVVTKTVNVQVVSDYDYLSDSEWKSVTTQHGTPRRNNNIKGRVNNETKTFDKGFGIHANGKITYDLSNLDYDNFEALVGVDMSIESQGNSSVVFKVIGDGKVLATTSVIKHKDNMVAINVPVKDINELVIEVTDAGNGNTSDHAVIANPKLTTNNAKPSLSVTDKTYKVGDTVDLNEGIIAVDSEDGDITSNVEIVSNNFEEGKAGRFEIVYKVTDSDNNVVEKTSYITMYEVYDVIKSKYGSFNNLEAYNNEFKIPVQSVSNNAGNYGSSVIGRAIDGNINTHWETNKPNSSSFNNEVIFDLGEAQEISKIAYSARRDAGGKGFANKFEIYVSNEAEGNDFILAGEGEYKDATNHVVEFNIQKTTARRVKFKFIEANQGWASLGEVSFYREDALSNKIANDLFTDSTKTDITENYNTLEKVDELRNEVKNHPAYELFEVELTRAEQLINAKVPTLTIGETAYVKLNSEFDLMEGVVASDQEDGDITSNIVINKGNFNIGKTGEYTITYTVTDSDNNIVTKERTAVVYSSSKYISDVNWESARTDYGQVRKDLASGGAKIKVNVNGEEKVFEKGIGTHANSEIVYNLEGTNYEYFESYIGVDRNISQQNNSSIIFKVFADGKEVYNSGLMKWADEAKLIRVPLKGVNELKLVIDNGGNGNTSDHGDFADAKFLLLNTVPVLEAPNDTVFLKRGTEIDVLEDITAIDAEDGNLIDRVVVDTGEFNINVSGNYPITYTVTDSDNNIVTKSREFIVYTDKLQASDVNWVSATSGWREVNKDSAVASDNKIKLKINGAIKEFDKGIGAATNAEIVYDLSHEQYGYFTTYVGTDKNYDDNRTTIVFKVFADGKEVYTSDVMRRDSEAGFVKIDLTGVKELKLIADNYDGNGLGDFASWGEPTFYVANGKPSLTIPSDSAVKVGETLDNIVGEYSALDIEDGDLTASVVVTGQEKINFKAVGKYPINYTVVDSDGNKTKKVRIISVVNMDDFTYLTDYNWKSAVQSHGSTQKDKTTGGTTLRLTNENGAEVSYERGIGSHANATIIYDLTDKDYQFFSSYVGVDRAMYGTVGSVQFEVYVDGEKAFDSGVMNSRDPQKYVEVNIAGAKELKLIVKDGGNGIGSDHATWGDAKLHYASSEGVEIDRTQLDALIENVSKLDRETFTEESFNNLQIVLEQINAELANGYTQEDIDNFFAKLNEAYEALENAVDLTEVINITDKYLKQAIKSELNISSKDITIGDMYNLTELNVAGCGIASLEGLQYAKNLETLNLEYNEINDLSQLKGLKKLKNLQAMYQNIVVGSLYKKDNKITINYDVIDRNGERLSPIKIVVRNNKTYEEKVLNIEECVDENGVISFYTAEFDAFVHSVYLGYEDDNYLAQVLYMFDNR